jgi:glycosyltransferase involved in cell wall biosynthesis
MRGRKILMKSQIFIIDDFTKYSKELGVSLTGIGENVHHLGPKKKIKNKFNEILKNNSQQEMKKLWSSKKFAIQIYNYVKKFESNKIVHIQHEFFGQSAIGSLLDNFIQIPLLLFLLKKNKIMTVITLHSILPQELKIIEELLPDKIKPKKIISKIFLIYLKIWYSLIGKLSSKIIVHGECFKNTLIQDYGIKSKKIYVVRHGILTDFNQKYKKTYDEKIILYFGVISPRKGIENLIESFKIFFKNNSNSKLVIIGKEPEYYKGYLEKIKQSVKKEKLEKNIIFTGFQEDEQLAEWLSNTNILVLPYTSSTAASGVFSIGLNRKIPMIVTKTKFFEEETENGSCALLVPPNNNQELSNALKNLLENIELGENMLKNQNIVAEKRSWNNIAIHTQKTYSD